ncbi:MAG: phosphoribosyltransferase [Candidatus Udaeobacter sp.]
MKKPFLNRTEAGKFLAENLSAYVDRNDVFVLGLPRGGVPVGIEVAKRLKAPLDVFVVRKLGLPDHLELTMGAIATGGVRVTNRDVVEGWQIPEMVIDAVAAQEQEELVRRERVYRGDFPPHEVKGKTVILVDDGIATGSTMLAAVVALRQLEAGRVVAAAPVIAGSTYDRIRRAADDVAAVIVPEEFYSIGEWYEDFSLITDEEVHELLAQAKLAQPVPTAVQSTAR